MVGGENLSLARLLADDAIARARGARECMATTYAVSMRALARSNVCLVYIVGPSPKKGGGQVTPANEQRPQVRSPA
eukprot:2235714-Pleurochrysis_carterae.AAC.3